MSSARDRLLDVLLEEEIGDVRPPDVALRVAAAARAETGAPRETLTRPTRHAAWRWVSAAALVLLGVGLGLLLGETAVPTPLEVVSDVELLAVIQDGPSRHGKVFGSGAVVHAGEEIATLSFPGEVRVVLQPGAFVRLGGTAERPSLTYGSGKVTVLGGDVPLAIVLPAGTVQVDAQANGRIDRIDDPEGRIEPDDTVLWVASEDAFNLNALIAAEPAPDAN